MDWVLENDTIPFASAPLVTDISVVPFLPIGHGLEIVPVSTPFEMENGMTRFVISNRTSCFEPAEMITFTWL